MKFAGAAINLLRRWLTATEIGDIYDEQKYLDELAKIKSTPEETGTITSGLCFIREHSLVVHVCLKWSSYILCKVNDFYTCIL